MLGGEQCRVGLLPREARRARMEPSGWLRSPRVGVGGANPGSWRVPAQLVSALGLLAAAALRQARLMGGGPA